MTVDVHDAIAPLAEGSDALAERAGAPQFARPGWFGAWWPAVGAGGSVVATSGMPIHQKLHLGDLEPIAGAVRTERIAGAVRTERIAGAVRTASPHES